MYRFGNFTAGCFGAWLLLVPAAADAGVLITVDKVAQQMTVEVDGATRFVWPVSTGRRGYETPSGNFKPFRLEEDHYSKEWDDAPMPHSIFFTDGGHAIHGSFETRRLGRRASHGCVRLAPRNAAKLFSLVRSQGLANTRVTVLHDPNAPIMAKRQDPTQRAQKVQQARKSAPGRAVATTTTSATATGADIGLYAGAPPEAVGYPQPAPVGLLPAEGSTAAVESMPALPGMN